MAAGEGRWPYRTDSIRSHNQIYNRLGAILKQHFHAIRPKILQSNKLLVELNQALGNLVGQCLLQDQTLHPARFIQITRVVRHPRINNLACIGVPG